MILILGASGYIGYNLFNNFKKENFDVLGTYYKSEKPGQLFFDLETMNLSDLKLKEKPSHIIFSAATKATIDSSKEFWEDCYKINVERTKKIIDFCFENDIIPVYISTDNVFSGEKGNYLENDNRNPVNCYGKIRYDVENYLLRSEKDYLIVRIGRVFGIKFGDKTLLTSMVEKIKCGGNFKFVVDQRFTPIYSEDLFYFMKFLIKEKYTGIFHLASCPTTTHYEIAQKIKEKFNLNVEISSCTYDSLELLEKRPKLINLNIEKIKKLTNFEEKSIDFFLSMIS